MHLDRNKTNGGLLKLSRPGTQIFEAPLHFQSYLLTLGTIFDSLDVSLCLTFFDSLDCFFFSFSFSRGGNEIGSFSRALDLQMSEHIYLTSSIVLGEKAEFC